MNVPIHSGLDAREIKFRMKKPMTVFFFKSTTHSTYDLINYLCSALLEKQDSSPATWHRLEEIIHATCLGMSLFQIIPCAFLEKDIIKVFQSGSSCIYSPNIL